MMLEGSVLQFVPNLFFKPSHAVSRKWKYGSKKEREKEVGYTQMTDFLQE